MNMLTEKFGRRRRPANNTGAERDRIFGSASQDRSDRRDTAGQDRFDRQGDTAERGRFDRGETADRGHFDRGETAERGRFDRRDDDDRHRGGRRRGGRSGSGGARFAIAKAITTIAAIIATLIVVGIVLVLLKANPANDIVDALREIARFFAQPFDAIFELERRRPEIALNWGIAAVVYLVVAGLIAKLLTR